MRRFLLGAAVVGMVWATPAEAFPLAVPGGDRPNVESTLVDQGWLASPVLAPRLCCTLCLPSSLWVLRACLPIRILSARTRLLRACAAERRLSLS